MSNGENIGFIRSLVDRNFRGFIQEFESFLDQCPSFLYHVGEGRFLPVFFFSMFATAHNANILNADERVYFRFDNHGVNPRNGQNRNTGNLKVAVLTNKFHGKQRVVRCYSISDRPNSDGLRFSTKERNRLVEEIIQQNPGLNAEDLSFEQYRVYAHGKGKSQGEAIAIVFETIREKGPGGADRFARYSASEINSIRHFPENQGLTIKEIEGINLTPDQNAQLNQHQLVNFVPIAPGQQGIDNFMEMLASDQRQNVRDSLREDILEPVVMEYEEVYQYG